MPGIAGGAIGITIAPSILRASAKNPCRMARAFSFFAWSMFLYRCSKSPKVTKMAPALVLKPLSSGLYPVMTVRVATPGSALKIASALLVMSCVRERLAACGMMMAAIA